MNKVKDKTWILLLVGCYCLSIAWYLKIDILFQQWNYFIWLYTYHALSASLYFLDILSAILVLIFVKRIILKLIGLIAVPVPLIMFILALTFYPYGKPQLVETILSPNKAYKLSIYDCYEWMSLNDTIMTIEKKSDLFPKTIYVSDIPEGDKTRWLDNNRIIIQSTNFEKTSDAPFHIVKLSDSELYMK